VGGDSLQWHAWYADAWLTTTARTACGRADSLQRHARHAGALTHGKWNVIHYAKQHQLGRQPVCTCGCVSHRAKVSLADLQLYWNRGHWVQTAAVPVLSYYSRPPCENLTQRRRCKSKICVEVRRLTVNSPHSPSVSVKSIFSDMVSYVKAAYWEGFVS